MNETNPPTPQVQPEAQKQYIHVEFPRARPFVTYSLIAINVILFILQMASESMLGGDLLFYYGGKINQFILQGQVWRLLTPAFLHANLVHIGFNMYALYILGNSLERFYGKRRFLTLYLLSALAGNVVSFLFSPAASLGASTAIFGLFAAEGAFILQNRPLFAGRLRPILLNMITLLVINLGMGIALNFDNWGHLGGIFGGGLFAWVAGPVFKLNGIFPNFTLEDQRKPGHIWLNALAELALLSVLTLGKFLNSR